MNGWMKAREFHSWKLLLYIYFWVGGLLYPISMALAMNHIIHLDPVAAPIHILENIGAQVVMAFFCVPPAPSIPVLHPPTQVHMNKTYTLRWWVCALKRAQGKCKWGVHCFRVNGARSGFSQFPPTSDRWKLAKLWKGGKTITSWLCIDPATSSPSMNEWRRLVVQKDE